MIMSGERELSVLRSGRKLLCGLEIVYSDRGMKEVDGKERSVLGYQTRGSRKLGIKNAWVATK
jgi:hypothetical protein